MYSNDRFTGPRVNTSGFGQDSTHQPPYESSYVPNVTFPYNQERTNPMEGPKKKSHIVEKIEALFPFLQDIMGQNDARSNQIISKLVTLRDGLDGVFNEI
jgi:hypothetical protein